MVVASTTRKSGPYNFNGVTTEWPITFEVNGITEDEVLVYQVLGGISILIESNYTVDLENLEVVYPSVVSGLPPFEAEDGQILIVRELSILQGTDFKDQGAFRAEDIEDQLDRWAMIAQQLQEQLDRTAQSDISDNTSDPEIGALLQEIADARDEATLAAAEAGTYADNAAASASAALVYASSAQTSASNASDSADDAAASASQASTYADNAAASLASFAGLFAFGTPVSKSDNTVYQATTDGFLVGTIDSSASNGTYGDITGYTDSSNPPTTVMGYASGWRVDSTYSASSGNRKNSFCMPVKRNNYYKGVLTTGAGSPTATYYFVPIGS